MKRYIKYILLTGFILNISPDYAQTNKNSIIRIETGNISGVHSSDNKVISYKGIPYALPPVNSLRWKAPQPAASWEGVRICNTFGPSPFQNKPAPFSMWSEEFLIPEKPISEDCLYLNVWSPVSAVKKPVLVWIYGGGFSSGGSAVPIYDGEAMAKKGIVFVSLNYRVGIFGFFAHPELTKESGIDASGNYGLMDQIAALKWIQKNIEAFGGDPENVTIAGQSAGSVSVNALMTSALTKGLFRKAIAESGASMVGIRARQNTLKQAEETGSQFAAQHNNASLEILRSLSSEQLLKDARGSFRPIIDGYVLKETIQAAFASGKQHKVPLLTGWNQNEGLISGPVKTAADFKKDITALLGTNAEVFFKFYPADTDEQASNSQYDYARDMNFGIQAYTLANQQSKDSEVYMYRFARKLPATGVYIDYGAFHTGEVPYAYDNLKFVNRPWEPVDHELARIISSYWANFVISGDPNGIDLPKWPVYTADKQLIVLSEKTHSEVLPGKDALDFLIKLEY